MDEILWRPQDKNKSNSQMQKFLETVNQDLDLSLSNYAELHSWSIENLNLFWKQVFSYFSLVHEGSLEPVYNDLTFIPYPWFPNVKLNFAENLLRTTKLDKTAIRFRHESGKTKKLSYQDLKTQVHHVQEYLRPFVGPQDVVAAYMPNIPETVIAMLSATSLGGVFTSTSCDFGVDGVLDRFGQSQPKILIAAAAYTYNDKRIDLLSRLQELEEKIPSLEKIIIVDFLDENPDLGGLNKAILYSELQEIEPQNDLTFLRVPFSSPLYIMYSSGTTGKPKCIVHSVGGTLLQHVKELGLHTDLTPEKNLFYFTTCGWMMWNWLVSGLSLGSTITLYEGSPSFPSLEDFVQIIEKESINIFGTSPKFLRALESQKTSISCRLDSLESVLSTGAPLSPEQFDFVYNNFKSDIRLSSIAGGTDLIGCFVLGNPLLPVRRGYIQGPGLGMDVACFDEKGNEVFDQQGELVCRKPFPSVPLGFLNDPGDQKFKSSYFEKFPSHWHHGDFISVTPDKMVKIFGRSDATLNPGGVRIGTAEIYRQTDDLDYIVDSLVVGKQTADDVEIYLFVRLASNEDLSSERVDEIKKHIRKKTTPRHVPSQVIAVQDIPYTRSGKKMELAVSRILNNQPLNNIEAVSNPDSLDAYYLYSTKKD